MGVVVVCSALVLLGLIAIVRWGGLEFRPPPTEPDGDVLRRYLWYVAVTVASGIGAGLMAAGSGGRLAMRLLAATAGDAAQGHVTEADEVVGRITTGGSIGLVLFVGLFFGLASGLLYMVIRRWLPAGRLGGLAFGALLLVVFAPAIDPLRKENPDFDLVGPGWLAALTFVALVLAHGMLVAAVAARYGRSLPLLRADGRVLARYSVLLLLFPLVAPVVVVAAVGASVVGLRRFIDLNKVWRHRRAVQVGRVVLVVGTAAATPSFIGAMVDIAGRGP
jgi:hypothetical protein